MEIQIQPKYTSLIEVYMDATREPLWMGTFVCGLIVFAVFTNYGKHLHSTLLSKLQQTRMSALLFASYCSAFLHAVIISCSSVMMIVYAFPKYRGFTDEARMCVQDYEYSRMQSVCGALSSAYFVVMIPMEMRIPEQSASYVSVMLCHHLLCVLLTATTALNHPIISYFAALGLQVEISNIFMHLRAFGKVFGDRRLYFVGGIGLLITYPVTRIVAAFYFFPLVFEFRNALVALLSVQGYYLYFVGALFVVVMSVVHVFVLFGNPKQIVVLNANKVKDDTKKQK